MIATDRTKQSAGCQESGGKKMNIARNLQLSQEAEHIEGSTVTGKGNRLT